MLRATKARWTPVVWALAVTVVLLFVGCGSSAESTTTVLDTTAATDTAASTDTTAGGDPTATTTSPGGDTASSSTTKGTAPMSDGNPVVVLHTSKGDITLELDAAKAPISTQNFLDYASAGYYDTTIFHRVIPGFMVQGGGFTADMATKPGGKPPIKNEAGNGLKNLRGTVAMARTGVVDSATSQFFVNVVDNGFLDHRDETANGFGYAVFGKVTAGMDVVDAIVAVATTTKGSYENVPVDAVTIDSVTVQ
jgi:cyclophilin family peptidyl-prolyl cis-trans isomerase